MGKVNRLLSQKSASDGRFQVLWLGLLLLIIVFSIMEFAFLNALRWFDLFILIVLIRAIIKPDTQAAIGMMVMCALYFASAAVALYFALSMHALVPDGIHPSTHRLLDDLLLPEPFGFLVSLVLRIVASIILCAIVYAWFQRPYRIANPME